MRSILGALTLALVLSLAAVFAVQWSVVRVAIETMMESYVAAELRQDAEELSTSVFWNSGTDLALGVSHFDPVFVQAGSGRYFQISAEGSRPLRSLSLGEFQIDVAPIAPGASATSRSPGPGRQLLLLSRNGYLRDGRQLTIAVAADVEPIRRQIDAFLGRYTQLTLAMFVVLVVLQVWIVRRALAPLRSAQADVARLESGEISQLGAAVPSELLPFVTSINTLLSLLGERLQRSREALGNLSHALKAPLTLLTQLSDQAAIRADPALQAQMQQQLRVLGERIDHELRRARVAGQGASVAVPDLAAEIDAIVMTMRKLHADRNLDLLSVVAPDARFRGDREDLLELSGNLLDNACKWARQRVRLTVAAADGFLLTIEDDGPGCPEVDLQRIVERGVRLDESTAGHGLGLAIVRNIVSSYGGELRFGRSETLGGLLVSVAIPFADRICWRSPAQSLSES